MNAVALVNRFLNTASNNRKTGVNVVALVNRFQTLLAIIRKLVLKLWL